MLPLRLACESALGLEHKSFTAAPVDKATGLESRCCQKTRKCLDFMQCSATLHAAVESVSFDSSHDEACITVTLLLRPSASFCSRLPGSSIFAASHNHRHPCTES